MAINNFNVGVGTTSQLTRYRYVATGGETSISGADADGKTLSYTVGLEQVFLNGVNLVRGQDYTATNGTSIGNLTALVASDSLEVFAYVPFNIANAVTASTVDAKGDLLVGTAADTVGRLAVGTNGQLLSAASGETSGLKWLNGGLTLIKTESFSAVSSVNVNDVFSSTYDRYKIIVNQTGTATGQIQFRFRVSGTDNSATNYRQQFIVVDDATVTGGRNTGLTIWPIGRTINGHRPYSEIDIINPFDSSLRPTAFWFYNDTITGNMYYTSVTGALDVTTSYTGFTILAESGNITGAISVYGYNK